MNVLKPNKEIWLPIKGFENLYLISNFGRIKSLPKKITLFHGGTYFTKEKFLQYRLSTGYKMAALFNGETRVDKKNHRLVAETFIPNPKNKPFVNHKDGNKLNCYVGNLEWVTNSENMAHAGEIGLMSDETWKGHFGLNHPGAKKVINSKTGIVCCVKEAAKISGYSTTHMTSMLKGDRTNKTNFKYAT